VGEISVITTRTFEICHTADVKWTKLIGGVNEMERKWLPSTEIDIDHPDFIDGKHFMTMSYEAR
jgi:hypothetical protein